jgi:hypothetical protein
MARRADEIRNGDLHTLRLNLTPRSRPPRAFQ